MDTLQDATLLKFQVPENQRSVYDAGVSAGNECRMRLGKPSIFQLVGSDEHSRGFRAGYFERAQMKPAITVAAPEMRQRDDSAEIR